MYITVEGIDGSGKTSILEELQSREFATEVMFRREPGGTVKGEIIREWLTEDNTYSTDLLMYLLNRSLLQQENDIEKDFIVVDRGLASTLVYNDRSIDQETLLKAHSLLNLKLPHVIVYIHASATVAYSRVVERDGSCEKTVEELNDLLTGYRKALTRLKMFCKVIDIANDNGSIQQKGDEIILGLSKLGISLV